MDDLHKHDPRKLFYVEVIDEDGDRWVNWEWANTQREILSRDTDGSFLVEVREATESETSAWNDGNGEGFGTAMAENSLANWNGVMYKLVSFNPMVTVKVFKCGVCGEHFDFEKVASIGTFYLSTSNTKAEQDDKSILWHVCIECSKA